MPEENEPTRICSVVFLEIAQFSQQPSEVQFSWRIEMSMLLDRCLEGMEPERRIVNDTSNGAVLAFPLSVDDALSFVQRIYNELPKLQSFALRVGVHLGPLSVVQGAGGRPGIAGEGVNAAQRAMRFAGANEVLVSRAFQEEALRLTAGGTCTFLPHGKQSGKLGPEHDLFRMGTRPEPSAPAEPTELSVQPAPPAPPQPSAQPESPAPLEPPVPPTAAELPVFSVRDISDADATPPAAQSRSFGFKAALAVLLAVVVWLAWLWGAPDSVERSPAAPPVADSTGQDATAPVPMPKADDAPAAIQPGQASPGTPEDTRLTDVPPSGKVAAAKKDPRDGSVRCPNCSCTDLMTKLSLGEALNERERRYMTEHCKK